ncbi:DUF6152 family protein [Methylomonas sp. BW4-1]|uniref:DUF6152 family protein n=1 Tax=Methylomonas sp. BW4-1 TaxID=3376685 RepID=UPI0040412352
MNTKGKLVSVIVVGGLLSLTAPPAHAHHAFSAEFDAEQPIELKGVVTKLELVNPHSWLYLSDMADRCRQFSSRHASHSGSKNPIHSYFFNCRPITSL